MPAFLPACFKQFFKNFSALTPPFSAQVVVIRNGKGSNVGLARATHRAQEAPACQASRQHARRRLSMTSLGVRRPALLLPHQGVGANAKRATVRRSRQRTFDSRQAADVRCDFPRPHRIHIRPSRDLDLWSPFSLTGPHEHCHDHDSDCTACLPQHSLSIASAAFLPIVLSLCHRVSASLRVH